MSKPQPKKIVRINENALVDLIDNKLMKRLPLKNKNGLTNKQKTQKLVFLKVRLLN